MCVTCEMVPILSRPQCVKQSSIPENTFKVGCYDTNFDCHMDGLVQGRCTPLLMQWSYVFHALTHWYDIKVCERQLKHQTIISDDSLDMENIVISSECQDFLAIVYGAKLHWRDNWVWLADHMVSQLILACIQRIIIKVASIACSKIIYLIVLLNAPGNIIGSAVINQLWNDV